MTDSLPVQGGALAILAAMVWFLLRWMTTKLNGSIEALRQAVEHNTAATQEAAQAQVKVAEALTSSIQLAMDEAREDRERLRKDVMAAVRRRRAAG